MRIADPDRLHVQNHTLAVLRRLLPLISCWLAGASLCAPDSHCRGSDPCSRSSAPGSRSSAPGSPSSAPGSRSSAPGSWWRVPGSRSGVLCCCWRICPRSWFFSIAIKRQTWCNGNGTECNPVQMDPAMLQCTTENMERYYHREPNHEGPHREITKGPKMIIKTWIP